MCIHFLIGSPCHPPLSSSSWAFGMCLEMLVSQEFLLIPLSGFFISLFVLSTWHKLVIWEEGTSVKMMLPSDYFPHYWLIWVGLATVGGVSPGIVALNAIRKQADTSPSIYNAVLPGRCARAMVVQSLWEWPTDVWSDLKPTPWDGLHIWHCLGKMDSIFDTAWWPRTTV